MKNTLSLLLVGVLVCAAPGFSRAQAPEAKPSPAKAQSEPMPPQVHRNIAEVLKERDSAAAGSPEPSPAKSKKHLITINQSQDIRAGGRVFIPHTRKCAEAIQDALNRQTLVPAPDEECADMME